MTELDDLIKLQAMSDSTPTEVTRMKLSREDLERLFLALQLLEWPENEDEELKTRIEVELKKLT